MRIKTRYEYRILFNCGDTQRIPYMHPYHYISHKCRACGDYRIISEYQQRMKVATGEKVLFDPQWQPYEFPHESEWRYAQRTGQSYGDYQRRIDTPADRAYTPRFV